MENLLDIRDELAAARNLVVALHMACDARSMPSDQRAALCELSEAVRQRLQVIIVALDKALVGRREADEAAAAEA